MDKKLDIKNLKKTFYKLSDNISGSAEYGGNTLENIAKGASWVTCYSQLINYFRAVKEVKNKEQIILDAGCGQAELLDILRSSRKGNMYIGIELNNRNINKCKNKFKKPTKEILLQHDLTLGIPLDNNSVDITVCALVLEHLKKDEAFKLFYELVRVTKKNGKILILIPIRKDNCVNEQKEHIYEWYNKDVDELLHLNKNVILEDKYFSNVRIADIKKSKYKNLYTLLQGKVNPMFIRVVLSPLINSGRDLFLKFKKVNSKEILI